MESNRMPAAPVGKRWMITGSATGIGALLAQTLLNQGISVVATDKDSTGLAALQSHGADLLILPMDLRQPTQIIRTMQAARDSGPIDILVNNAAIFAGGPFEELDVADVEEVFAVNVFGAMRVSQALIPTMRERRQGRIINISSDAGLFGLPFGSPYSASKWALEGFSEAIAHELALFDIGVSLLEICGSYGTSMRDLAIAHARARHNPASPYAKIIEARLSKAERTQNEAGDPGEVVAAIIRLAADPLPPLRVAVGPKAGLLEMPRLLGNEPFVMAIRSKLS
jgi:NAD(P)-dependent dehydrogenase (short-subunit alcohol dehydrogenase family)